MFGCNIIIFAIWLSFISSIIAQRPCTNLPTYCEFADKSWPSDVYNIYLTNNSDPCEPSKTAAQIVKLTAIKRFVL